MDIDEQIQLQERLGIRKKLLDDVFHNMIIALERLESFLEFHRNNERKSVNLKATAMFSTRDLHDDQQNPPTIESVLGEVQLQCSALFFQTKLDDEKLFKQTMKYFMTDLLEWYGGRGEEIPYDEVEMYVLPILVALSRQIDSVTDIMRVCDDYVGKVRRIEDFSDEEKENAIKDGFIAFLKARHLVGEQLLDFAKSDKEVLFSVHQRGNAIDGYNRLMAAMLDLYNTTTPAKKVRAIFNAYVQGLPEFDDAAIENAIASKKQTLEHDEANSESEGNLEDGPADGQTEIEDKGTEQKQKNCTEDASNAENAKK